MVDKKLRGFYIDKLQSPLVNTEELFWKLKSAEDEYARDSIRNEIVVNNLRSIHHIIHRRYGSHINSLLTKNRMTYDDLYSIGYHSLVKAMDTFDITLGYKFTTLSFRFIHHGFSKYFYRLKTPDTNLSVEAPIGISHSEGVELTIMDTYSLSTMDEDFEASIVDMAYFVAIFEELEKLCKPRDIQIVKEYLHSDISQLELGKKFGISQVQVGRILKKVQAAANEVRDYINFREVI